MAYISTTADPYALIYVTGSCVVCGRRLQGERNVLMAWGALCDKCEAEAEADETPRTLRPYDPRTETK